jgi:hypothetical protein
VVSEQPRLLSPRRANVAGIELGLANVELTDCRFAGAHNLDKLRLEADISFASAPGRLGWDWRQVIADERAWRAPLWPVDTPVWPSWVDDVPAVLEAGRSPGYTGRCARAARTPRTSPARQISIDCLVTE